MTKIESRDAALIAMKDNRYVYQALRFFVTSKQADTDTVFEEYLALQGYSPQRSAQLKISIIKYLESALEKRTYRKYTKLGIDIPLSLLIILSKEAEQSEYDDFNLWRKTLSEPLITAFLIDDDPTGCFFLTLLTNLSQHNIVTLGSALNLEKSIESVLMIKPDILVVDHMLPEYDEGWTSLRVVTPKT